ncbi:hypothetical protein MFU01_15430 [Myxococcus fulvus]|uniref:Uncharacterized protein n=1 Tax=Myxococcus fulvus TaxID=33 RepID=A0A511SX70_MYXFU|nr:hypothetical protein MFU01_15430 [Myxococcus fulvus]
MEETKKPAKLRNALLSLSHISPVYLRPDLLAATLHELWGGQAAASTPLISATRTHLSRLPTTHKSTRAFPLASPA